MATHVLQFEFNSPEFTFPFAHVPTAGLKASHLHSMFWDAVCALDEVGFTTEYVMFDGASINRSFLKSHFTSSPIDHNMSCPNLFSLDQDIIHFLDPTHVIKRLRNMVLGKDLVLEDKAIAWKHWEEAYGWNTLHNPEMQRLHYSLTENHVKLSDSDKMRNQLAEEVLNKEMLFLFQSFARATNRDDLSSTIKYVSNTSIIVSVFNDKLPIFEQSDERLKQIALVLEFFKSLLPEESHFTRETHEDVLFLLSAFLQYCTVKLGKNESVSPITLNSDVVENFFCQQRSIHHGANNNPNYLQYTSTVNSIVLGATSNAKRKSNTGNLKTTTFCSRPKKSKK